MALTMALHVLAAVLATWRLTELVVTDRLTESVRRRFAWYVLRCGRCVAIWAGGVATVAYLWVPWANWPFALAWLYLWWLDMAVARRLARQPKRVVIAVDTAGLVSVERTDFTPEMTMSVLTAAVPRDGHGVAP